MAGQGHDVKFVRRGPRGGIDMTGPQFLPWLLIFVACACFVVTLCLWVGGWVAAMISDSAVGPDFSFDIFTSIFSGGVAEQWPGVSPILIYVCAAIIAAVLVGVLVAVIVLISDRVGYQKPGLAGLEELSMFTLKERAAQAIRLRPNTLKGVSPNSLHPREVGVPIGEWHGHKLYGGWEDVSIAIMAPRSGKTSAIGVPQIIAAPGPVVVTSNKSDIFSITVEKRQRDNPDSTIWAFDPQGVVQAESNWYWNPLAHVEDFDTAMELALMFVNRKEADDQSSGNAEFFQSAGRNYLAYLFLAAALPTKTAPPATLREVDAWLDTSDPMDAIFRLQAAGQPAHAKALKSTVDGPPETVGGIIATARDAAVALKSEKIIRWVTPGEGRPEFSPEAFIDSKDTLYLMSNEKSASAAAPLIAAFASRIFDVGTEQASRRYKMRLDPPLVAVLDEAANICKIPGLPGGYSHYGSRGICVTTIFQNSHQPVRVWGKNAWQEMWSAATVKLIGPGIDDPTFAEELSKLVGSTDQDVGTHSTSQQGSSYSVTVRQESILGASDIRTIEKSKMLMLATATKPAMLDQVRYYQGEHAKELNADEKRIADFITEKARINGEREEALKAQRYHHRDRPSHQTNSGWQGDLHNSVNPRASVIIPEDMIANRTQAATNVDLIDMVEPPMSDGTYGMREEEVNPNRKMPPPPPPGAT